MGKCLHCKKELLPRNPKYCSNLCQGASRSIKAVEDWLIGKASAVKGKLLQIKKPIREYLLYINDNACSQCNWAVKHPKDGRIPLQIHHKDGNASNNRFNNLEVLCPNCHSITESYGARNKVSARRLKKF